MDRRPYGLLVLAALLLSVPAFAQFDEEEQNQTHNKTTQTPNGHPIVDGHASDQLRAEARDLRQRADDVREAADALREQGGDEGQAEDLDDRADYLEDRARIIELRADEQETQGAHATHGLALPAPSPSMP